MKNIHVLPTQKSSRLSYNKDGLLELNRLQWRKNTQNIYITSDEIKDGEWCVFGESGLTQYCSDYSKKMYKKIILTDNKLLIKDGVQAIDDEFLEWFVNNPSCEEVEVEDFPMTEKYNSKGEYVHKSYWIYKIIIPKKETKQEFPTVNGSYGCTIPIKDETKQETLEELKKWKQEALIAHEINQKVIEKLMAEKKLMYSEEEVIKFAKYCAELKVYDNKTYVNNTFEMLLQQFKNK